MSVKRAFFSIFQKIMVVCCAMFFGFTSSFADTQYAWKYTPLEIGYTYYSNLLELTESNENFRTYTVKSTTTTSNRCLYIQNGKTVPANHKYFVKLKLKSNFTQTPYLRYPIDGTYRNLNLQNYQRNEWSTGIAIITPTTDWAVSGAQFGILPANNGYVEGETITVDRNGFVTIFDLTEIFGAGHEPSTAADAEQLLLDIPEIKIATTAYNTAQFSPVVNDLNTTIATIRDVVTNTINQTKAIADLQAKKQTRPDEQCPAGKKCLLVEDNDGVPHWYEIIENVYGLPAGYTPLEYIRSSGVAYIDTGYSPTSKTRIELVAKMDSGAGNVNIAGSAISSSSGSSTDALLVINSFSDTEYEIKFGPSGTWPKGATNMTTKNTFSLSATEFRVNNVVKETYSGSVPDTGNKPFYLFQRWRPEITSTDSKVQIYEFNIYENGTLVRRMVPAKQGTTVGMYDTVGNRFYTKSGTGSLTAGPEI